jgi:hypothetical protein
VGEYVEGGRGCAVAMTIARDEVLAAGKVRKRQPIKETLRAGTFQMVVIGRVARLRSAECRVQCMVCGV